MSQGSAPAVKAAPRQFTSLREFLDALRDLGDLREVNFEVDTDLEIGAIIRRVHETYAPAPLFTNIRVWRCCVPRQNVSPTEGDPTVAIGGVSLSGIRDGSDQRAYRQPGFGDGLAS